MSHLFFYPQNFFRLFFKIISDPDKIPAPHWNLLPFGAVTNLQCVFQSANFFCFFLSKNLKLFLQSFLMVALEVFRQGAVLFY
jgi:hypothetical protein